jgi:hypothetical protein
MSLSTIIFGVIHSKDECSVPLIAGRYLNEAMANEYSAIVALTKLHNTVRSESHCAHIKGSGSDFHELLNRPKTFKIIFANTFYTSACEMFLV